MIFRLPFGDGLPPDAVSVPRRIVGSLFVLTSLTVCLLMALQHFAVLELPGCEPGSGCADAIASEAGQILSWPLSFIGLAYFSGLVVAWLFMTSGGVTTSFRVVVRIGVLLSLGSLWILYRDGYSCPYCVVIHVANICFWLLVELSHRSPRRTPAAAVTTLAGFALVTAFLNIVVSEQRRTEKERIARELFQANEQYNSPTVANSDPDAVTEEVPGLSEMTSTRADTRSDLSPPATVDPAPPMIARQPFRAGTDDAKVRLLVFTDYQSAQCWRIEQDVRNLLAKYGDRVSVTIRHFPLCTDCNYELKANTNPNACRAALAAEAAGLIKGSEGFWQMHRWLVDQRGQFSDEQLSEALVEFGYDDVPEFLNTMSGSKALAAVLADVIEARSQRISAVPAVIFNGRALAVGDGLINALNAYAARERKARQASTKSDPPVATSPIDSTITDTFSASTQLAASAATVRIVNPSDQSSGSGVIIARRDPFVYVLTAHHIAPQLKQVELQTFARTSYPKPFGVYSYATVIANSEQADLAVIRFSTRDPLPKPLSIVPLDQLPAERQFSVFTIGCEGRQSPPTCQGNEVLDKKRVRRSQGDQPVTVWEVARETVSGRSGGPLVDAQGRLLGIASGISNGKGYFVHAEEIHQFLKEKGLQVLAEK